MDITSAGSDGSRNIKLSLRTDLREKGQVAEIIEIIKLKTFWPSFPSWFFDLCIIWPHCVSLSRPCSRVAGFWKEYDLIFALQSLPSMLWWLHNTSALREGLRVSGAALWVNLSYMAKALIGWMKSWSKDFLGPSRSLDRSHLFCRPSVCFCSDINRKSIFTSQPVSCSQY